MTVRRALVASVAVRVVAALVLVLGPWTDEPRELAGWDVERFQAIADLDGQPWVDEPVEYPPGSVVLVESLNRGGVVGTHRLLVLVSLAVDLAVAFAVGSLGGRRAAVAYLVLGLPLVPMGLLRFDLWAAAAAIGAVAALAQRRPAAFALFATAGAMVKIWPAAVIVAAVAVGRWRSAALAVACSAITGLAWLGWAGWTVDPVTQVVSMRDATGWHLESIGGSITALITDDEPQLQQNAFRIGTLDGRLVLAGRVGTVVATLVAVALALRRPEEGRPAAASDVAGGQSLDDRALDHRAPDRRVDVAVVALVMIVAVGTLIVTSPLLSPQFLLWLTPWLALAPGSVAPTPGGGSDREASLRSQRAEWPRVWWLGFAATALTGITLAVYSPSGLAEPQPALLLLGRDALLVLTVGAALVSLTQHRAWDLSPLVLAPTPAARPGSGGTEDPLGAGGASPGPAGPDSKVDEVPEEADPLAD